MINNNYLGGLYKTIMTSNNNKRSNKLLIKSYIRQNAHRHKQIKTKITNPITGRKVLKYGRQGIRILYKDYTLSPSGRLIKIDGLTYKKLQPSYTINKEIKKNERAQKKQDKELKKLQEQYEEEATAVKIGIRRQAQRDYIEEHQKKKQRAVTFQNLLRKGKYQTIIDSVIKGAHTLTHNEAVMMYNRLINDDKYILKVTTPDGIKNYTLSDKTKDYFIITMSKGLEYEEMEVYGSDQIDQIDIRTILDMRLSVHPWSKSGKVFRDKDGRFFPFVNNSGIDLMDYQIYTKDQAYDKNNTIKGEHCLMYTLSKYNICPSLIEQLKLHYVKQDNKYDNVARIASIRKSDLKKICKIIKKNIKLYFIDELANSRTRNIKYIIKDNYECIDIALYKGHYFKYEDTKYTTYAIKHFDKIKDLDNFENIYRTTNNKNKKYYKRDNNYARINSLDMIKLMFKNNMFGKLDLVNFTESVNMAEVTYLDNIEDEQREVTYEPKEKKESDIWYADTETRTNRLSLSNHQLLLLGFVDMKSDNVTIYSPFDKLNYVKKYEPQQKLIFRFVDVLTQRQTRKNVICYFHNLKYDYKILEKWLNVVDKCEKDNQIYNVVCRYGKSRIEFRDSYKLIDKPLSKFGEAFNLKKGICKKEAIAYDYYTTENHNKYIKTSTYRKHLSRKDKLTFDNIIKQHSTYDSKTDTFNPTEYYKEYLTYDCLTLKHGLEAFNKTILDITDNKMSIYDNLTISSFVDEYMLSQGVYDGVYEMTGNLRNYLAKAVYGGRVAVNKKYVKKLIEEIMSDYDGVSLYPSAIKRLCRELGLFTGKAKRFNKDDLKNWNDKLYSVVTIKITKVNKIQQIPFIAYKDKDRTEYTNTPRNEKIVIDSITLNDYIKFHDIEYEIYEGVYWNDGLNKKMGEVVQKLFNERLKHKKNGNKIMSDTLKLILNSAYGKTMIKKTETKKVIKRKSEKDAYLFKNWNTIKTFRDINDRLTEFDITYLDESYNRAHIGCAILSYSKRIMNEVFDVANDNGYPIYYTDTDSIHIKQCDVKPLEQKYEEKYNKKLNGKQLEQFHTDFSLKNAKGEDIKDDEIYATKSIFLGKKSYLDVLESVDKKGIRSTGYHVRLKGITKEGLEEAAKKYDDGYYGLYKDLAKGTKIPIVLNPYNKEEQSQKVLFQYGANGVRTRREFVREVSF